jgi:hypothetical protein
VRAHCKDANRGLIVLCCEFVMSVCRSLAALPQFAMSVPLALDLILLVCLPSFCAVCVHAVVCVARMPHGGACRMLFYAMDGDPISRTNSHLRLFSLDSVRDIARSSGMSDARLLMERFRSWSARARSSLRCSRSSQKCARDAPTFVDLPTCPAFMTDALFVT